MDPALLVRCLNLVIHIPKLYVLINEFVGTSDNESAAPSSDADSDQRDNEESSILSSPVYSAGENFDPSEHFRLEDNSEANKSEAANPNLGNDDVSSIYDSEEEYIPRAVNVRRSPRLQLLRGRILYTIQVTRNGRHFTYPVHLPSTSRPTGFDVANHLPDDYYEHYSRAPY